MIAKPAELCANTKTFTRGLLQMGQCKGATPKPYSPWQSRHSVAPLTSHISASRYTPAIALMIPCTRSNRGAKKKLNQNKCAFFLVHAIRGAKNWTKTNVHFFGLWYLEPEAIRGAKKSWTKTNVHFSRFSIVMQVRGKKKLTQSKCAFFMFFDT